MKKSEPGRLPTVRLEDWFSLNQVKPHSRYDKSCFHRMAGLPVVTDPFRNTDCEGKSCRLFGHGIMDHVHRFRTAGRNRIDDYAGVMSAPYKFPEDLSEATSRIADEFGLSYRINDPKDDYYGYGTTSLVIWNPDKVNLA